jgi:transglutaminase-like putative cysteine protease
VNVFFSQSADTSYTQGFKYFNSAHVRNEDTRDVAFLLPSLKIQSDSREVSQLSSELVQGLSSDREKAMAFHDWLTREVTYDVDGASNGSYRQRRQDAIATIESKLAVCEGYANTFAALARASGIRAKVVIGRLVGSSDRYRSKQDVCDDNSRELHAWNEVYADNRWITVDATLDAGSEDGMTGKFKRTPHNHELFDPSPSYFEMTHVKCYDDHQ